jgi:hybrid cluster-associated redox disulfide protein
MEFTKDSIIGDILNQKPQAAPFFLEIGMHCLGCPAARNETLAEACQVHNQDADALLEKINNA